MADALLTMTRYRPDPLTAEAVDPPTPAFVEVRRSDLDALLDMFERLKRRVPETPVRPGRLAGLEPKPEPAGGYPGRSLCTEVCARLARDLCAHVFEEDHRLMRAKPRGARRLAAARQFAMHLVHIVAGRRHEEVARAFARNRSTASHHFEVMEDLREVPAFDRFVDALEESYRLRLMLAEVNPKRMWGDALGSLRGALETGLLDQDADDMAAYMVGVFKGAA